jgi:hypothetical protein
MPSSVRTGSLKRWRHYLLNSKDDRTWSPEENKRLLSLHSTHLNKWKFIATLLPGRTGGQVKNQFFNIIRTLLRKAFKMTFKRSDSLVVSEIKPKVISDIVNRTVTAVAPKPTAPTDNRTIKDYLMEFVGAKNNSDTDFARAKEVLLAIKVLMKDTKFVHKRRVSGQEGNCSDRRRQRSTGPPS